MEPNAAHGISIKDIEDPVSREAKKDETLPLAEIVNQYQVKFVHGIRPYFTPQINSLLHQGVGWEDKLKILLAVNPTISASTIRKDDNYMNMFSRMGVILSAGEIVNAHSVDAGTVAKGLSTRAEWEEREADLNEQVRKAIEERGTFLQAGQGPTYNEFIIKNPGIAGFYICNDDTGTWESNDLVSMREIGQVYQRLGLPIFIIEQGVVYKAEDNPVKRQIFYSYDDPITPLEIIEQGAVVPPDLKAQLAEEVLVERSPFELRKLEVNVPEIAFASGYNQGRETYLEVNCNNLSNFPQSTVYKKLPYEETPLRSGVKVQTVGKFSTPEVIDEYFMYKNQLFRRRTSIQFQDAPMSTQKINGYEARNYSDILRVSVGNINIENSAQYLYHAWNTIKKLQDELKTDQRTEKVRANIERRIISLAFHILGYGQEAARHGETSIQEKALALFERIMLSERGLEIISRRVDDKGRIKLTEEDLNLPAIAKGIINSTDE